VVTRIISLFLLISCVNTPNENNQFDECNEWFYSNHSEELKLEEWHKCMQGENDG